MRKSRVIEKFRSGQCATFAALGHYLPFYIRHAAHCEFDGIWLDLEHRAMEVREVQSLLSMCHQFDIDCMVRAPTLERTMLYRYFEDGASGLLMPLIDSPDEAKHIARSVKFPPIGNRGLDGAGLDSDYQLASEGFVEDANRETFIIVQIETLNALKNAEAIAAIEGIDGLFVGPGDLGLRLGLKDDAPNLEAAIQTIATAAQNCGKIWGIAGGNHTQWKEWRANGAQLLIGTGDFTLRDTLEKASTSLNNALQN
jgi:4-hydroxy-2-oxoheptanedioate aldolase